MLSIPYPLELVSTESFYIKWVAGTIKQGVANQARA